MTVGVGVWPGVGFLSIILQILFYYTIILQIIACAVPYKCTHLYPVSVFIRGKLCIS